MRVQYDASVDMAYISLGGEIGPGEAVRQVPAGEDGVALLDLDADGRLLGIEVPDARARLRPGVLEAAERIG
ncbi:DUF2283 domain-containing protein [Streptomyces sp. NPDC015131]|uniref:DUF2283 domain-containing protein n=1 Tax=Streptomyces sp. NPDC015131 TaxID=3364941 RepID=UPI0036FAAE7C